MWKYTPNYENEFQIIEIYSKTLKRIDIWLILIAGDERRSFTISIFSFLIASNKGLAYHKKEFQIIKLDYKFWK